VYSPGVPAIALAIVDDIPLLEVAAACDIFGTTPAELDEDWYDFSVCGPATAQVGGWFRPIAHSSYKNLATADTVVIPACGSTLEAQPSDLVDAVRAAYDAGARIVAICTGAFVLAAAGLLDGRRATTHWMHADTLASQYPRIDVRPDVLYVEDGNIFTSAGKTAGIDLCIHIVRLDYGAAVANAVARRLVMPPHRDGGQTQFILPPPSVPRDDVADTLLPWVTAHIDEPLSVVDLARQVSMSTRQLTRRFASITGMTPLQWLHTQRILRAQELLETTDHTIEHIATMTAMGTAATLRRHFNRAVGVPPDTYRRSFRTGSHTLTSSPRPTALPAELISPEPIERMRLTSLRNREQIRDAS
jgi:AraC family transcriptional activator FtrA